MNIIIITGLIRTFFNVIDGYLKFAVAIIVEISYTWYLPTRNGIFLKSAFAYRQILVLRSTVF